MPALVRLTAHGSPARKAKIETLKEALNLVYDASAPSGLRPRRLIKCLFNWLKQIQYENKMPIMAAVKINRPMIVPFLW